MKTDNAVDKNNRTAADLPIAVSELFPSSEGVAQLFAEESSFIVADGTILTGRQQIKKYFEEMVANADKWGTSLNGVRAVAKVEWKRELSDSTTVIRTRGGLLFPGEQEITPDHEGVQTWTVHREEDVWLIVNYQNTRLMKPPTVDDSK